MTPYIGWNKKTINNARALLSFVDCAHEREMNSTCFEVSVVTRGKGQGKRKRRKHVSGRRLTYGVAAVVFLLLCFLVYFFLYSSNQNGDHTSQLKAAIIDHLSISQPNQTFYQTSKSILNAAGFSVWYYPGGAHKSDVDFYRDLPKQGFKLIIFRVHSALHAGGESDFVVFFTSEEYSSGRYFLDEYYDRLVIAQFHVGEEKKYFGISPLFVKDAMNGRFDNTIIIVMGCDGLKYTSMAEAFIGKGAKAYISWNGPVGVTHTDLATTRLLQKLFTERHTIGQAVAMTMNEVGSDPTWGSTLLFYPPEAQNYVVPNSVSELTLNVTEIHRQNSGKEKITTQLSKLLTHV